MYVRARPVIDKAALLECLSRSLTEEQGGNTTELYFNSATAAFKWFLTVLREKAGKPQRVAVQVLTCDTVKCAIEESGNVPVFMDVSPGELTTLFPVVSAQKNIDVLLLSHLYGLANTDYPKIREWCHKNQIVLINDLAQTVGARVGAGTVESYGDYYLYSFGFDKPISAGSGGMLKIKADDEWLFRKYDMLPRASDARSRFDLKKFAFYYDLTANEIYRTEFRRNTSLEKLIVSVLTTGFVKSGQAKALHKVLASMPNKLLAFVERGFRKFSSTKIPIKRLGRFQTAYLRKINSKKEFVSGEYRSSLLELALDRDGLLDADSWLSRYSSEGASCGQRITILHPDRSRLIEALRTRQIEAGVFNWPRLLCPQNQQDCFPNALHALNRLINLPTWSAEIWKK
jgi:dTDP-4-amino-4,6-dideoxygalactose transaminase